MELLMIFIGLIIIAFGSFVYKNPEKMNQIRDRQRLKEKVEYTEHANNQMVLSGILLIILGLIVIGINIFLLLN